MVLRASEEREKLIIDNMYLVYPIAKKYADKTGFDINELLSYGYEGLIEGVDNYDESLGVPSAYLYKYIMGYILMGLTHIQTFCSKNVYFNYLDTKIEVEEMLSTTLEDNINIINNILELMLNRKQISLIQADKIRDNVLGNNIEPIQQHKQDLIISEDVLIDEATREIRKDVIFEYMERAKLKKTEKTVLIESFGLLDDDYKNLTEVANKINFSVEGVRKAQNRAISKLLKKQSFLFNYYDLFENCSFDTNKIKIK